jgi:hypothetical protein
VPRRKKQPLETGETFKQESPPLTQEARETRIISLAMDLAEERIRNGTASAQEVTYWLRLGSQRDRLEREMMEAKNELLLAKTEAIKTVEKTEKLYAEAIKAFRMYGGEGSEEDYDDDGYEE